ncbi:MAG TPA: YlxR family protein [Solirubrobacteraceae bacterium]|jgi:hypothetical protein
MPHRRCVGCGRIAPKPELVRIVAMGEPAGRSRRAVLDVTGKQPGRGAYLCRDRDAVGEPTAECLALAKRRGGVARALRCAVTLAPSGPDAHSKLVESVSR